MIAPRKHMRTKLSIAILAIFLIGSAGIFYANKDQPAVQSIGQTSAGSETTNPQVPTTQPTGSVNPPVSTPTASGYTMAQVAKHTSASSCWSAINGNVYDLTSWVNQHPGGAQAILSICGIDGSAAFNDQHGGQRRPANELAGFKIGPLVTGTSGTATSGSGTASAGTQTTVTHTSAPSQAPIRQNDDD